MIFAHGRRLLPPHSLHHISPSSLSLFTRDHVLDGLREGPPHSVGVVSSTSTSYKQSYSTTNTATNSNHERGPLILATNSSHELSSPY